MTADVEFEVPARAEYVGLLRVLVSSLAADRRELDDDRLDDLRLALSEACSLVVDQDPGTQPRLAVTCREDPGALTLDVYRVDGRRLPDGPAADAHGIVPLELIGALVDDASRVSEDGVDKLRLRLACPPSPPHHA